MTEQRAKQIISSYGAPTSRAEEKWRNDMAGLRNKHADMEIGYVNIGTQKKLYVQVGHERQYYGTLMSAKADKFLRMLEKWDEAGGNDE